MLKWLKRVLIGLFCLVLAMLAFLSWLGPVVRGTPRGKSCVTVRCSYATALFRYRDNCHTFPLTDEGLSRVDPIFVDEFDGSVEAAKALCEGRLKTVMPNYHHSDPWHRPYIYESDGRHFKIGSFGSDGAQGGSKEDEDCFASDRDAPSCPERKK